MAVLSHGTDLSLSPTLGPLVRQLGGTVRGAVDRLAQLGFESVQLDATLKGVRPRELDRSGRRDLHALVRRRGARAAGLDCFIPPEHYTSPEYGERALAATLEAIELAGDLGRLAVSLTLPVAALPEAVATAIVDAADRHDLRLAVHAPQELDALIQWIDAVDLPALGAGLDPAAVLATGADPCQTAQQLGARLAVARLSDRHQGTGGEGFRCAPGQGRLDLAAYRVSVDLAEQRYGPVVLELRGVNEPLAVAEQARQAWDGAAFSA
jgi:sugar phosphate isomerase/epimerase